jgi:hypothetical protein
VELWSAFRGMATGGIGGRWREEGLVGIACRHRLTEAVVDLENGFFGAVVAVFGFVFALHDGEGVYDVADGMAGRGENSVVSSSSRSFLPASSLSQKKT